MGTLLPGLKAQYDLQPDGCKNPHSDENSLRLLHRFSFGRRYCFRYSARGSDA
jgi:hypothetical protein